MRHDSQDAADAGMRKILVATDFSAASARARDYAIALAAPEATLSVLYAHPLPLPDRLEPAYVPDWMPPEPSIREELLERLRLFAAPAGSAGLLVDPVLKEGHPADVILRQAARIQPDLIAMGTHGRGYYQSWIMGSVAERVGRLAPAAVLTVSALSDPPSPRREVLCPLGLETGFETLAFASEVARRCGSVLNIMHVVEDPVGPAPAEWVGRWARERLSEAVEAAGTGVRAKALLGVGSPYQEILRVARERRVGLIVMGIHDTHQPCRGFFGSTAAHIVREAQCAVITVPSEVGRRSVAARTSGTTGMAAGGFIP